MFDRLTEWINTKAREKAMFQPNQNQFTGDKKKMIRLAVALSTVLLVIWAFLLQQKNESTSQNWVDESTLAADSLRDSRLDSLRIALGSSTPSLVTKEEKDSNSSGIMATFILLAIAVGGLWWWTKKNEKEVLNTSTEIMREVATQNFSNGQSIMVTEFNGEYWFFSSSATGMNLMQRLPKNEWNADSRLHSENGASNKTFSFNQIMQQFGGGKA